MAKLGPGTGLRRPRVAGSAAERPGALERLALPGFAAYGFAVFGHSTATVASHSAGRDAASDADDQAGGGLVGPPRGTAALRVGSREQRP